MGEINVKDVEFLLEETLAILKEYSNRLSTLCTGEIRDFICMLAKYLYLLFCSKKKAQKEKYYVYPQDASKYFDNTDYADLSETVIRARNCIAHGSIKDAYCMKTYKAIEELTLLKELLISIGVIQPITEEDEKLYKLAPTMWKEKYSKEEVIKKMKEVSSC